MLCRRRRIWRSKSIEGRTQKLTQNTRNLKYAHLTSVFRQHNIHLVLSTCQHKFKHILCTEKPVLKASFQDVFWCTNINNYLFCFEKTITTCLLFKNSLHATRISSFKYVFIVFFEKKLMLKYTLYSWWSLLYFLISHSCIDFYKIGLLWNIFILRI